MRAVARVNGEVRTDSRTGGMQFSWDELLAAAARNTPGLQPGDVIGSGTVGARLHPRARRRALASERRRGGAGDRGSRRFAKHCGLMALARTAPLRSEIERLFPERPFNVEFWDGTALPSTERRARLHREVAEGRGARAARPGPARPRPRVRLRRPRGERPRPGDAPARRAGSRRRSRRADKLQAGRRRGARRRPHRSPAPARRRAASPRGAPPHARARPPRRSPPLRRLERLLRPVPRRVDDLQLRDLLPRREDAGGGPGRQERAGVHQARR